MILEGSYMAKTKVEKTDYQMALAHKYRCVSGGDVVPGVTTIIDVINKPQLVWWAARLAAEAIVNNGRRKKSIVAKHRAWLISSRGNTETSVKKRELGNHGTDNEVFIHWARGAHDREKRAKGDRGTRVHSMAEAWSHGEAVEVSDEDIGFLNALESFHVDYLPRFELVECIVLNEMFMYGGRFDGIVTFRERIWDDEKNEWVLFDLGTYLIDYKSGGEYEQPVALQAEGYLRARLAIFNDAGVLMATQALPHVDGCRTIYLKEDGTYKVSDPFEKITHDDAWDAFIACRKFYAAQKTITQSLGRNDDDN